MTYRVIEPIIESYYSKQKVEKEKREYNKEIILSLVLSYMSSLNRSFNILMQISTKDIEEKVSIQLATILDQFMLDDKDKLEMKKATLRYWINRLLINKWEETPLYNYLFVKLEELGVHAINKIVQPRFAKSFSNKDILQIQKIAVESNRLTIIYSLLISILIFFSFEKFINIFFGPEFLISKITFFIILLNPLINSFFGSVGAIINMSGNEIETFKWSSIALTIGLLSNFIFVPIIGINGVAISTLIASLVRGFALWFRSLNLLKVNTSYILNEIFKFQN